MTTDRSYRKALAAGEAVERLKLAAGTQFDPDVVKEFEALMSAGLDLE
jgi:HD-GYP domain-containing protein (c-di-GMP phosphodiesterase class II)